MPFNHLYTLLVLYPDKPWDWYQVSQNPSITWEIISAHPEWPWDKSAIYSNPRITWEIVDTHIGYSGSDFYNLSINPNITWKVVETHSDLPWDYYALSRNPSITFDTVRNNLHKPWDWYALNGNPDTQFQSPFYIARLRDLRQGLPDYSNDFPLTQLIHPNLTVEFISNNFSLPWNWDDLSMHPFATWEVIDFHYDWPWNWENVSQNVNITLDIIDRNPDRPWNWLRGVSQNPNLRISDIESHFDKEWDWEMLSIHDNITIDDILGHPDWPWVWNCISCNCNLTMDMVRSHPEIPWNWDMIANVFIDLKWIDVEPYMKHVHSIGCMFISSHPCVTWDIVQSHPQYRWCKGSVSENSNLTWRNIVEMSDCVKWGCVSMNRFDRYNAAVKIQRRFRKYIKTIKSNRMTLCRQISYSVLEWYYSPDGPGYKDAKSHFGKLIL